MADRKKVMEGLEACSGGIGSCDNCPYAYKGSMMCDRSSLMRDALELLNRQVPRVLSWEEVDKSGNLYVWTEIHSFYTGRGCLVYCTVVRSEFFDELFKLQEDSGLEWIRTKEDYNWNIYRGAHSGWRCWTSRPTPEQMRDTKWKGEDNG